MNPMALLLSQASWAVIGPVLDRLDAETRRAVLGGALPERGAIVSYVLGHGSVAVRASLAENTGLGADTLRRLADDPAPEVAACLVRHPHTPRDAMLRAAAAYRPGPLGADGTSELSQRELYALIESRDPAHIAAAVPALRFERMYPGGVAVLGRALLNLWRLAGRTAAASALASTAPLPETRADAFDEALADDDGRAALGRMIEHEGRTQVVVGRLRGVGGRLSGLHPSSSAYDGSVAVHSRLLLLAPHERLRWDVVRHEDSVTALPPDAVIALGDEPDRPDWIRERLPRDPLPPRGRSRSQPERDKVRYEAHRQLGALTVGMRDDQLRRAFEEGLIPAAEILAEAPSAYAGLLVFNATTGPRLAEARTAVNHLAAEFLGAHTEAWAVALRLLRDFGGTLPELLATARAASG